MPEMESEEALVAFALATLQTAVFTLALLMLLFLTGSLGSTLATLNTIVGFVVFAGLWLTTFYCTSKAMREVRLTHVEVPFWLIFSRGVYWGGINGAIFFVAPLAILTPFGAVYALVAAGPLAVLWLAVAVAVTGFIGSTVAFSIGAAAGLAAALITAAIWSVADVIVHPGARGCVPELP